MWDRCVHGSQTSLTFAHRDWVEEGREGGREEEEDRRKERRKGEGWGEEGRGVEGRGMEGTKREGEERREWKEEREKREWTREHDVVYTSRKNKNRWNLAMFRLLPPPPTQNTSLLCAHSINHTIAIHSTLLTPTHMYPHTPHTCILLTPHTLTFVHHQWHLWSVPRPWFQSWLQPWKHKRNHTHHYHRNTPTTQVDNIINHSVALWTVRWADIRQLYCLQPTAHSSL